MEWADGRLADAFQFPSNGKAYPKLLGVLLAMRLQKVSIPFKRESVSKGRQVRQSFSPEEVSIPFKRESVSKDGTRDGIPGVKVTSFQFPSNGKAYPKLRRYRSETSPAHAFQFPSNGKAYPKWEKDLKDHGPYPFQFPSNGKAYPKQIIPAE